MASDQLERLTKAELVAELRRTTDIDPETRALADVVSALKPLVRTYWRQGSYHEDTSPVVRVIRQAEIRLGIEEV